MAGLNGKMSTKSVEEWFSGLSFEQQRSVLDTLSSAHDEQRETKRAALLEQLSALDGAIPKKLGRPATKGRQVLKRKGKVAAKYRDPKTKETWSGRGRMASWLAAKVEAGDKVEKYLI